MLSSWHKLPFEVNGITYQTMEHWFQSQKFPDDPALQNQIRQASTPNLAKKLGQQPGKIRSDWFTVREDGGSVREDVMYEGLLAKFSQHPELEKMLIETGDDKLIYANPLEKELGIGLSAEDPRLENPRKWLGKNLLGEAIKKVRAKLRGAVPAETVDLGTPVERAISEAEQIARTKAIIARRTAVKRGGFS